MAFEHRWSAVVAGTVLGGVALVALPVKAQEPTAPRLGDTEHFTIDPVLDGVLVVGGATFSGLLNLVLSSGEIKPTIPGSPDVVNGFDHVALTQTVNPHAGTYSNYGLGLAVAYAVVDPILAGVRYGRRALLVDAVLYAESISMTSVLSDVTKIAVRRPRPIDYTTCAASTTGSCVSNTDLQLSFFSGHTAITATIAATATYLAFVRSGPRAYQPWVTLVAGTALTAFVGYMRVRSGEHFPTDVIAAAMAGGAIGILVPHLHRRPHYHGGELEAPSVLIGYAPALGAGGCLTVGARF